MANANDYVKEFRKRYHQLNQSAKLTGSEPIFKLTSRGSLALSELSIPDSERTFRDLVENLHLIITEGSGDGQRLPDQLDNMKIAHHVKRLRNYYVHDQSHGNSSQVRRKYIQIGNRDQLGDYPRIWKCST